MVTPGGRYRDANMTLRIPRIQCFIGHRNDSGSRMDAVTKECTYDGDDKPKENRGQNHYQVDLLSSRYLFPLYIARNDEKRDE